ncbi:hypothetical protein [Flavobacterium sp.]
MSNLILIYRINKIVFIITLILYVTVFFGMLFQTVLGTVQLLTAAYITFRHYKKLQKENRLGLKTYWAIVGIDLLLALLFLTVWDTGAMLFIFLFPMIIAGYFLHVLNEVKHEINGL